MRRNKSERQLQERAIIRELQMAKSEGVEIPDDLEKRLERFQQADENNGKGKGGSTQKEGGAKILKPGSSSGEYKVHPTADIASPDRRMNRNYTRYGGAPGDSSSMNMSDKTALSSSQSKLIRNQVTDDGFGGKLRSPFDL